MKYFATFDEIACILNEIAKLLNRINIESRTTWIVSRNNVLIESPTRFKSRLNRIDRNLILRITDNSVINKVAVLYTGTRPVARCGALVMLHLLTARPSFLRVNSAALWSCNSMYAFLAQCYHLSTFARRPKRWECSEKRCWCCLRHVTQTNGGLVLALTPIVHTINIGQWHLVWLIDLWMLFWSLCTQ